MSRAAGELGWRPRSAPLLFAFSLYVVQPLARARPLSDVAATRTTPTSSATAHVPSSATSPLEYPPAALVASSPASYMSWSYATSFAILMGVCGAACIAADRGGAAGGRRESSAAGRRCSSSPSRRSCSARSSARASTSGRRCSRSAGSSRSSTSGRSQRRAARARLRREALAGGAAAARGRPPLAAPRRRRAVCVAAGFVRRGRRSVLRALRDARAHGVRAMFADQFDRPLQVESLGSAVLMAASTSGCVRSRRSTRTARRR